MYCKNCGYQIDDNSKFCSNCGENLSGVSSGKLPESSNWNELKIKLSKLFGIKISNRLVGIFLIWFLVQVIIYLVNGDLKFDKDFWPFSDLSISCYDLSELFVFTIAPLILLIAFNLLISNNSKTRISKLINKIEKPNYGYLVAGIILLGLNVGLPYLLYGYLTSTNEEHIGISLLIVFLGFRAFVAMDVVEYVGRLNRSKLKWGGFSFLLPMVSLIVVAFMPKKNKENADTLENNI